MIDPESDRAVYRQLADTFRAGIADGTYAPGAKLPSEERLTQEYGLSRTTVRRAIGELINEGLVEVSRAAGTMVRKWSQDIVVDMDASTARARMPTPDERRELGIGVGVPVLIVERSGSVELHAADRTVLRCRCHHVAER